MQQLVVVGAGNFARELVGWLPGMLGFNQDWQLKGILTDTYETFRERGYDEPLLGGIVDYSIQPDDLFVIAISATRPRLEIAAQLAARGARFATLIHESVLLSRHVTIAPGTVIFPRSLVSCDVTIGAQVLINCLASVGHDAVIGDGCTMSSHCEITGNVQLGRGAFMGSHATVLPKVKVGEFATLGAGSAIIRDVPANTTILGVPGKKLPEL